MHARGFELHSKVRYDLFKILEMTPQASHVVLPHEQIVPPMQLVQGPSHELLDRLKAEGSRTILEEIGLSTNGVVNKNPNV